MADTKITALTALTAADPASDVLPIVDISDTTMAASGTTKKISINNILGASGTATLASATITGDLTVDTSTLKVDSTNNRVGILTASPNNTLTVRGSQDAGIEVNSADSNSSRIITAYDPANTRFYINSTNSGSGTVLPLDFLIGNAAQYRIAASGVFTWYDGAGGTRMTLNATGLGVGNAPVAALDVFKTANDTINRTNATFCFGQMTGLGAGLLGQQSLSAPYQFNLQAANAANSFQFPLVLQPSGGNVGIGVTPSAWSGGGFIQLPSSRAYAFAGAFGDYISNGYYDGAWKYTTTAAVSRYRQDSGSHLWYNAPSGTAGNAITFTQAMTLNASGNLNLGDPNGNVSRLFLRKDSLTDTVVELQNEAATGKMITFHTNGFNQVGSISFTSSAVAYNTSSDYRLKESVKPISGGLARVNALKPSAYKWKVDGSNGEGFLAHELAEVVPAAVTGDKDAVDADGKPTYQGVDLSKLVPILVAAIQELTARVQTLEAK